MTLITTDAVEYLHRRGAEDLLETFQLKVIEDEALDGVDWKVARKRFDEKVGEDLDRTPEDIFPGDEEYLDSMSERERIEVRIATRPNWEFFIFVGKEEVDSVVDCMDDREKKRGVGYFVTMVQSDLAVKDMECEDERGLPVDDCEQHEDCRMALFQRFKAWLIQYAYICLFNMLISIWPSIVMIISILQTVQPSTTQL